MTAISLQKRQNAILYIELISLPIISGAYASTMRFHERLHAGRDVTEDDLAVAIQNLHKGVHELPEEPVDESTQRALQGLRENIEGERHNLILHDFDGFYQSCHDQMIDEAVERIFLDEEGEQIGGASHIESFSLTKQMITKYCAAYVELVKEHMKDEHDLYLPSMRLEEVISPREYNFDTDRIVVSIAQTDFDKLAAVELDSPAMQDLAREMFTPRSGFVPFYSADIADWKDKPIEEWDVNELGVLLKSVGAIEDSLLLGASDTFADELQEIIYAELPKESREAIEAYDVSRQESANHQASQASPSP